jgi:hypothetical protein
LETEPTALHITEEMIDMRKVASAAIVGLLVSGGALVGASDAHALGTVHRQCTHYNTATGESTSSQGGFTTNAGVCGTAKVRLFYRTYTGSPLYYTNWATSSGTARIGNPGNLVQGGNHGVSDPAGAYGSARDFSS